MRRAGPHVVTAGMHPLRPPPRSRDRRGETLRVPAQRGAGVSRARRVPAAVPSPPHAPPHAEAGRRARGGR
eukprot:gene14238-biopygen3583